MNFKPGMTVYYLNRNSYDPNILRTLIVECKITENNGMLFATSTPDGSNISISLNDLSKVANINNYIFNTFEEAQSTYNKELEETLFKINNQTKQELLKNLFNRYLGETCFDTKFVECLKNKIENEFDVKL